MLDRNEYSKIETYIDRIIEEIRNVLRENSKGTALDLDETVKYTVNKLTPESKMLLSSVYNMLSEKTLALPQYQNATNRAAFYARDIFKDMKNNYNFDVPTKIDYAEAKKTWDSLIKAGVIVTAVAGVGLTICVKSAVPVIVSAVLIGIMLYCKSKDSVAEQGNSIDKAADKYFAEVKNALLSWVKDIDRYYEKELESLEKGLSK